MENKEGNSCFQNFRSQNHVVFISPANGVGKKFEKLKRNVDLACIIPIFRGRFMVLTPL